MDAIRMAACAALLVALPGALNAQPEVAAVSEVARVASSSRVANQAIPHAKETVEIDGVLDDAIWKNALAVPLTVETYPRENMTPEVETIAYLVENGDQLLIAFDARDPDPESIRAYLRDRDSAFNDDFVGVVLDTFGDQRRAFEFFVNPLGVQMDLINDDINRNESSSWDAIWDSAGQINERGFTAEMAIPFSQLRFPSADGDQTWGIDVLRFRPRVNRARISNNPQDRNRSCYLCQFSTFTGFANAEPGKALEVVPTLTATRSDKPPATPTNPGDLEAGDYDTEAGLGVRWGITPDLTLDVTFNPDFSQVEADVAQLEENTTFALSYPETRPFFLEGQDFFSSPLSAVYTRTVADPDAGAKFTGRTGKNTIGMFATNDAITNLLFPGPFGSQITSLDQENNGFVGRYARGFGQTSQIGVLFTSREGDGYSNEVAGFDGRYMMNDRNTVRFQYLDSRTEYPATIVSQYGQPAELDGDAFRVEYRYSSRNWFGFAQHQELDPHFRADSGFIGRVDQVQDGFEVSRTFYAHPDAWFTNWQVSLNGGQSETMSGQLMNRNYQPSISFEGPWQSFAQLGFQNREEYWNGVTYDMKRTNLFGQFRPRSGLNINMQLNSGEQIDFTNSRLADQRGYRPTIDWNATRHLLVRLRYTSDHLSTKEGATIYEANLTDLRMTWQFNVRTFVRLTLQEQDIERNVSQYLNPLTDPSTESLATQVLYSYKLNPQTVIFAGYSDSQLDDINTGDLEMTGRTLFFKLSYAWTP